MAGKKRAKKTLPFAHKLVLHQWMVSLFGFDPLQEHRFGKRTLRPLLAFTEILKNVPEGMDEENLHFFYKALNLHWKPIAQIAKSELLRYEQNIASDTLKINERRERPIVWKYYQWLSLLFAELYLDWFFTDRDKLLKQLNRYIEICNDYWAQAGYETGITPYDADDLNKLCLQNATGSGKTLLMHVNFLQFCRYAKNSRVKHDFARTVLITPNEGLSMQHQREWERSGIMAKRLLADNGDLFSQVDFTEITKLSDKDGPNIIDTKSLGSQNLLLVDEAHRGMGSQEERGWFQSRSQLSENGFVFEYSATFKEAVHAAKRPEITESYAKAILFDYSYRYFYEDGHGKDYRIFNLPRTFEDLQFSYLSACLLAFYQQLRLYEDKTGSYAAYHIEKPLWVFVGSSVIKATGTRVEKATVSDVGKIIAFFAQFLKDRTVAATEINRLLRGNADETGLLDENGKDIFAGSFDYLKNLHKGRQPEQLLQDILARLFHNGAGGQLSIARIKGDENEIMLRVGHAETPFGLINVGDAAGLCSHIAARNFDNVTVLDSQFSETRFERITLSSSPINLLIGSKRFVEGWDCWRVSTLGLMHVGKSEGAQIIQLFGRGVRLKGHDWSLRRSSAATPTCQPEYIRYVETLNVFGIEADFMERFRRFLDEEELPKNDQKQVYTIPLNVTYEFGHNLKILCPRKKHNDGREYNFKRDGAAPLFGQAPDMLMEIDWYPRIQSLESKQGDQNSQKHLCHFSSFHLAYLDYDALFFRLEKFKRERNWHNLNISRSALRPLLKDPKWYRIAAPEQKMTLDNFGNVHLWQEMAAELLQKYTKEYYNYCKAAFIEPRLELRVLERNHFPQEKEYQLIVDADQEALIADIQALTQEIAERKSGILWAGELKSCLFGTHLYEPVLHAAKGSRIQIAPVSLNESEFRFLKDLRCYIEKEQDNLAKDGIELFLLRNESRGRGIGFFEAGNFYPDFLLWQLRDDRQYLSFIEPHGLQHEGPGHKKIAFHKVIKNIQNRLSHSGVVLNSFIVSPTRFANLHWGKEQEELEDMHVFFMENKSYIPSIIKRMID